MRKSVDIVSVIFVGRLGPSWLSAAGIAAVSYNVTAMNYIRICIVVMYIYIYIYIYVYRFRFI
jgi:hypothetical protein